MSEAQATGRFHGRHSHPLGRRLGWLVLLLVLAGCPAQGQDRILVTPGQLACLAEDDRYWVSVPWPDPVSGVGPCNWNRYPSQAEFVVRHELGTAPVAVFVYLAFSETGTGATLASGDLATVTGVDDTTITIRNQTNQDFFARVVLVKGAAAP